MNVLRSNWKSTNCKKPNISWPKSSNYTKWSWYDMVSWWLAGLSQAKVAASKCWQEPFLSCAREGRWAKIKHKFWFSTLNPSPWNNSTASTTRFPMSGPMESSRSNSEISQKLMTTTEDGLFLMAPSMPSGLKVWTPCWMITKNFALLQDRLSPWIRVWTWSSNQWISKLPPQLQCPEMVWSTCNLNLWVGRFWSTAGPSLYPNPSQPRIKHTSTVWLFGLPSIFSPSLEAILKKVHPPKIKIWSPPSWKSSEPCLNNSMTLNMPNSTPTTKPEPQSSMVNLYSHLCGLSVHLLTPTPAKKYKQKWRRFSVEM